MPKYQPEVFAYINMLGGMYVIVHVRGGGEAGESSKDWHDQGSLLNRQNTFDDFFAATEWLIDKKITDPSKIVAQGGSNGGMVMSAIANQRPDLYAMVKPGVPVTDVIRNTLFGIGKAWNPEYGNARGNEEDLESNLKWSPYQNVKAQKYPFMLVCTGTHDDRVSPLHAYKYVAQLQYMAGSIPGQNPLLLRLSAGTGHSSSDVPAGFWYSLI